MKLDETKIAEGAMAVLALTMFKSGPNHRAWKGMDWDVLNDLFERGWIHDPKGQAKSVVFTEEGRELAIAFMERLFGAAAPQAGGVDAPPDPR